jgi:hypothetical protein
MAGRVVGFVGWGGVWWGVHTSGPINSTSQNSKISLRSLWCPSQISKCHCQTQTQSQHSGSSSVISSHSHLLQQFSVGAVKFVLLIERSFEGRFHTGATKTSYQTHGDSSITLSTYILSASSVAFELISSFSLVSELRSASNEALLM